MSELGHHVIIQEGETGQFELFRHKGTNYNFNDENWISFMKEGDGIPKFFTLQDVEQKLNKLKYYDNNKHRTKTRPKTGNTKTKE